FDAFDAAHCESYYLYLDAAQNYTSSFIPIGGDDGPLNPIPSEEEVTQFYYDRIQPKLTSRWGECYPEGIYCSNGKCGCCQLSLAEAMSWLEAPTSIDLTYSDRDKDIQELDWPEIKKHVHSGFIWRPIIDEHLDTCATSEEVHNGIGRLCRQLGVLTNAIYRTEPNVVTLANRYVVLSVAKSILGVAPYNKEITDMIALGKTTSGYETFYDQLKDGIAIIFGSNSNISHAWVTDGGIQQGKLIKTYSLTYNNGVVVKRELIRTRKEVDTYFHFDWGWWGRYKGYFAAGVFDPGKPSNVELTLGKVDEEPDPWTLGDMNNSVEYFVIKK
ncbi:MAG: C10 family peptidase, partial [Muribaculaceae bacterium]|nr:C10 family peptidase [Muribaculaceae bacterium]